MSMHARCSSDDAFANEMQKLRNCIEFLLSHNVKKEFRSHEWR